MNRLKSTTESPSWYKWNIHLTTLVSPDTTHHFMLVQIGQWKDVSTIISTGAEKW